MAKPETRASTAPTSVDRVGQEVGVTAPGAGGVGGRGQEVRDRIGRPGGAVARVLDDGRTGGGRTAGAAVGVADGGGQLHAVAHGDVVDARVHGLAGVERRGRRRVGVGGQHRERRWWSGRWWCRPTSSPTPGSRSRMINDPSESAVPGLAGLDHRTAVLQEGDRVARTGTGQPGLVDGAVELQVVGDGGTGRWRGGGQCRGDPQSGDGESGRGQPQERTMTHATHEFPPRTTQRTMASPPPSVIDLATSRGHMTSSSPPPPDGSCATG